MNEPNQSSGQGSGNYGHPYYGSGGGGGGYQQAPPPMGYYYGNNRSLNHIHSGSSSTHSGGGGSAHHPPLPGYTKVYLGQLPLHITEDNIAEVFQEYSDIG